MKCTRAKASSRLTKNGPISAAVNEQWRRNLDFALWLHFLGPFITQSSAAFHCSAITCRTYRSRFQTAGSGIHRDGYVEADAIG